MITGILNPIITPFTESGEVDEDLLCVLAEDSIVAGCGALFTFGSAGQGPGPNSRPPSRGPHLAPSCRTAPRICAMFGPDGAKVKPAAAASGWPQVRS